jgi:hypothetical protein
MRLSDSANQIIGGINASQTTTATTTITRTVVTAHTEPKSIGFGAAFFMPGL